MRRTTKKKEMMFPFDHSKSKLSHTFLVDVHAEQPGPQRPSRDHRDQRPRGEEPGQRDQRRDGHSALDAAVADAGDGRERDEGAGES